MTQKRRKRKAQTEPEETGRPERKPTGSEGKVREDAPQGSGEPAAGEPGGGPAASEGEPQAEGQPAEERADGGVRDVKPAEEAPGAHTVPLEDYQRLLAEFDNYRKRTARELAQASARARAEVLKALLPVLDDFERARASLAPDQETFDKDGILIIMDRLAETLMREGLEEVEASPGQEFDPEIHEAVLTVPTEEHREGLIAQVLEKGYKLGEVLLRPARVAVARAPEEVSAEGEPAK